MSKADLRIDWATHEAARYACEHWHYSRTIPVSKSNYIGVWESGVFIGVVIFSKGASSQLGAAYGLDGVECSELTRVALSKHANPVSRIIRVALIFIKSHNPGLRLVVSFADTYRHHCGGIYQAGNWIYTGTSSQSKAVLLADGNVHDLRRYNGHGNGKIVAGKVWKQPKKRMPDSASVVKMPGKHRYLMPLDEEMRVRVLPLSKPYPKRPKKPDDPDQGNRGRGSTDPDAPIFEHCATP